MVFLETLEKIVQEYQAKQEALQALHNQLAFAERRGSYLQKKILEVKKSILLSVAATYEKVEIEIIDMRKKDPTWTIINKNCNFKSSEDFNKIAKKVIAREQKEVEEKCNEVLTGIKKLDIVQIQKLLALVKRHYDFIEYMFNEIDDDNNDVIREVLTKYYREIVGDCIVPDNREKVEKMAREINVVYQQKMQAILANQDIAQISCIMSTADTQIDRYHFLSYVQYLMIQKARRIQFQQLQADIEKLQNEIAQTQLQVGKEVKTITHLNWLYEYAPALVDRGLIDNFSIHSERLADNYAIVSWKLELFLSTILQVRDILHLNLKKSIAFMVDAINYREPRDVIKHLYAILNGKRAYQLEENLVLLARICPKVYVNTFLQDLLQADANLASAYLENDGARQKFSAILTDCLMEKYGLQAVKNMGFDRESNHISKEIIIEITDISNETKEAPAQEIKQKEKEPVIRSLAGVIYYPILDPIKNKAIEEKILTRKIGGADIAVCRFETNCGINLPCWQKLTTDHFTDIFTQLKITDFDIDRLAQQFFDIITAVPIRKFQVYQKGVNNFHPKGMDKRKYIIYRFVNLPDCEYPFLTWKVSDARKECSRGGYK